jgi:hypothetical protein
MVTLEFKADPIWLERQRAADLSNVSDIALKTSVLPGDQILQVSGVDFSLIGYRIPLLEFAHGLFLAVRRAASSVSFGETHPLDLEEHFRFFRKGEEITISADVTDKIARCPLHELDTAVRRNCVAMLQFLFDVHPEARRSGQLYKWFNAKELGAEGLFHSERTER